MGNLCVIPARGGSKRIPRKNIKDFLGKPVIAYSIETALKSGVFEEVMVSTDDLEISSIAQKYGATVPFLRSENNADDFAPTISVIAEVVEQYADQLGRRFDYVCCLYPTAPLATTGRLLTGLELVKRGYESVFPVVRYGHPIWRGMTKDGDKTSLIWKEHIKTRSQDLTPVFHDAGQWYWIAADNIPNSLLSDQASSIELPETEVQDIDNLVDWSLAELKYKLLHDAEI